MLGGMLVRQVAQLSALPGPQAAAQLDTTIDGAGVGEGKHMSQQDLAALVAAQPESAAYAAQSVGQQQILPAPVVNVLCQLAGDPSPTTL